MELLRINGKAPKLDKRGQLDASAFLDALSVPLNQVDLDGFIDHTNLNSAVVQIAKSLRIRPKAIWKKLTWSKAPSRGGAKQVDPKKRGREEEDSVFEDDYEPPKDKEEMILVEEEDEDEANIISEEEEDEANLIEDEASIIEDEDDDDHLSLDNNKERCILLNCKVIDSLTRFASLEKDGTSALAMHIKRTALVFMNEISALGPSKK